ncbi:MAG TPA: hypothetical protein VGM30_03600 [Puia sp.]|jgi:hypothetical protein
MWRLPGEGYLFDLVDSSDIGYIEKTNAAIDKQRWVFVDRSVESRSGNGEGRK